MFKKKCLVIAYEKEFSNLFSLMKKRFLAVELIQLFGEEVLSLFVVILL